MWNVLRRFVLLFGLIAIAGCAEDFGRGGGGGLGGALGGWERLGSQQVGPGADHDVFSVPGDMGPFRELRLQARGGSIEMNDVTITFENGETYRPRVRSPLGERDDEIIDLPGNRRRIKQIDFTYAPNPRRGGPVDLGVYGR